MALRPALDLRDSALIAICGIAVVGASCCVLRT